MDKHSNLSEEAIKADTRMKQSRYYKIWIQSRWRNIYPVWRWYNRKAIRGYRKTKEPLDDIGQGIVDDLNKYGIAITHIDKLFPKPEKGLSVFEMLKEIADKEPPITNNAKPFIDEYWLRGWGYRLNLNNPFVGLGVSPRILNIVNAYMGMYARFFDSHMNKTVIMKDQQNRIKSQAWHNDPDDRKLLKIFLYMTDVEEEAGPFRFILNSQRGGKNQNIHKQKLPPIPSYPKTGVMNNVSPSDVKTCLGKAGTLIFCNTTGLHQGGYSIGKSRTMFTACYKTNGASYGGAPHYRPDPLFGNEKEIEAIGYAMGVGIKA